MSVLQLTEWTTSAAWARYAAGLTRAGLSGLIVTHLPDLRYLCGFTGSSAALAMTRWRACLFTDGRYAEQAAEEAQAAKVEVVDRFRRGGRRAVVGCAAQRYGGGLRSRHGPR